MVSFNFIGFNDPSSIWCVGVPEGAPPPVPPKSMTDTGAIFKALRGGMAALNNSTVPSTSKGRAAHAEPILLSGLGLAQTDATVRCAVIDDHWKRFKTENVLSLQLLFSTPPQEVSLSVSVDEEDYYAPGPCSGPCFEDDFEDDFVRRPSFIIPIVVACVCTIACVVAIYYVVRARRGLARAMSSLSRVAPISEAGKSLESAFQSVSVVAGSWRTGAEPKMTTGPAFLAAEESDTDSDDDVTKAAQIDEERRLLEQALAMKQQLAEELERRGVDVDVTAVNDVDSSVSGDSENEGVLRDVKAFMLKAATAPESNLQADDLTLPDLPLMLPEGDEKRLDALLALAQTERDFDRKLAAFDEIWQDAVPNGAFHEARERLRGEQLEIQERVLQAESQLAEASGALERFPEEVGTRFVDALAADEEAVAKETDDRLRSLHDVALDWPQREAAKLEELLLHWTDKIHAVPASERADRLKVRKNAAAALRTLADQSEEALDAEMLRFETDASAKFDCMRDVQSAAWRERSDAAEAEAAKLRAEVARQRQTRMDLKWRAQDAAVSAALELRARVRDSAVEAEALRELESLDEELVAKRKEIERLSDRAPATGGDGSESDAEKAAAEADEMIKIKGRALAALQRAYSAAKKAVEDDMQRRKNHWHSILEERSRERIKSMQRRRAEEERVLSDETARLDEEAREAESRRRTTLLLGVAHHTEAAALAVTASVRRGRVWMGLQATAAEAVAEERLPKRSATSSSTPQDASNEASPDMNATALNWQVAKRKLGDELSAAVEAVGDLLTKQSSRQQILLTQRQRREAFLAGMVEGEDEKKEDLLDALEENLHREMRGVRWQFEAAGAEAMVHRGEGEETGLGRRLAAIMRDSDLLHQEDQIGERYESLRALVLDADTEMQRRSDELDKEAARLEAEAQEAVSSDEEVGGNCQNGVPGLSAVAINEELDAARRKLEQRHLKRSQRRDAVIRKATELQEAGRPEAIAQAADILTDMLMDASSAEGDDSEIAELQSLERQAMMRQLEVLDPDREAQLRRLEARRDACRRRREQAASSAAELRSAGEDNEAADILKAALVETDPDPDFDQIKTVFAPTVGECAPADDDRAAKQQRLRERLVARGKRRKEVAMDADTLRQQGDLHGAIEVLAQLCQKDSDADFEALKDSLCAGFGGDLDEDRLKQLKKLEARRAARKLRRDDAVERAEKLAAEGKLEEALDLAESAAEVESDADVDQLESLISPRREGVDVEEALKQKRRRMEERKADQLRRRKEALENADALEQNGQMQEALAVMNNEVENAEAELEAIRLELEKNQGAIDDSRKKQRDNLLARRDARRQRREDALAKAEALETSGQVSEALAEFEAVASLEQAPSDDEEDVSLLLSVGESQASDIEVDAARQRARLEARQAARTAAKRRCAELEAQGNVKEALSVMRDALERDLEAIEEAPLEDARQKMQASLLAGADQYNSDLADRRRKLNERRNIRKKKAETAAELKKKADSLRMVASKFTNSASSSKKTSGGPQSEEDRLDLDPLAAWQAESRRRSVGSGLAASCQRGQEEAARRLLDGAEAAEETAALKQSFQQDMERSQAAVASEREAQRKRAQERLHAQRRRREEEKVKQAEASSATPACSANWARVKKKFRYAFHGVGQLQKLHNRRRAKMLQEHKEIERKIRAEVEAEMRALQERASQEAEAQVLESLEKANTKSAAQEAERESEMQGLRDEGKLKAEEAQALLAQEKKRQADIIEQKLAKRKQRLEKREEKVKQMHVMEETQEELTHMQSVMHAKPTEKAKNTTLVKELGQVNALIDKLQSATNKCD